jgi:Ser/Thr protein kinase RdoA (MazF antagonist)
MYPAFREALFDGYATVRALPPALCVQADTMVALRQLHTLQWMSDDWRSPDERPWGRGFVDTLPDVLEPMCA